MQDKSPMPAYDNGPMTATPKCGPRITVARPQISRRSVLEAGLATFGAPLIQAAPAPKHNVLFISSDDLCNRLSCYGDPLARTPNFDRLARSGVRFDRHYCQFPLCNPSRSSLMTGTAPDTTRVWGNGAHFRNELPDAVTLPQLFQKNGYLVARAGKIYHYGNPGEIGTPGLDDAPSWQETVNPAGIDHLKQEKQVTNYTPARGLGSSIAYYAATSKDEEHTDSLVADAIISMMEKNRSEPWFLGAGFYKPHCPWIVPSKYFDFHPMDRIQALPFDESEMRIAPQWAYFTKPANWGMSELQRREAIRAYYASTTFLDAQLGRLLDALDRLDLARNTTIVFWPDHGYQLGEHGQWMKQTLFEPACRIPLLISGAGVEARGRACARTTEHLDIYPTLVDLCGLSGAPAGLHGQSLAPLLKSPNARWAKPAISQVHRAARGNPVMGYSIRTERYRYNFWNQGSEGEELYDYEKDPREVHNAASDPATESLRAELRGQLRAVLKKRGAEVPA